MVGVVGVLSLVVATASTGVVGGTLARELGFDSRVAFWLATSVLTSATITALTISLGFAGFLDRSTLFVLTVGLAAISIAVLERDVRRADVRSRLNSDWQALWSTLTNSYATIVLSVLGGIEASWLLTRIYFLPPLSWDGLAYHLPPVIEYIQEGTITLVGYSIFANGYPNTGEMYFLWNLIFLRDGIIVDGTQLAFVLVGALGIYVIATEIGIDSENAFLAGIVFFLSPVVLMQADIAYVDLMFGSLVIASYAFFIRYWQSGETKEVLLLSVCLGLLAGIKYTGGFFVILITLMAILGYALDEIPVTKRTFAKQTVVFALVGLLLGGAWYARNFLVYGNPVYPVPVEVLGQTIFDGPYTVQEKVLNSWNKVSHWHGTFGQSSTIEKVYLSWFEKTKFYDTVIGGFGPQWALLGIPAAILFTYRSLRKRDRLKILAIALFLIPVFATVEPWKARYHIAFAGFVGIVIGYARDAIVVDWRKAFTVLLIVVLCFGMVMSSPHRPFGVYMQDATSTPGEDRTAMEIRGLGPVSWDNYTEKVPPDTHVGFVLGDRALPYTLYGHGFRNRITYVGDEPTREAFLDRLERESIEYLVLHEGEIESEWVQETSRIEQLHFEKGHYIFEVRA